MLLAYTGLIDFWQRFDVQGPFREESRRAMNVLRNTVLAESPGPLNPHLRSKLQELIDTCRDIEKLSNVVFPRFWYDPRVQAAHEVRYAFDRLKYVCMGWNGIQ